MTHYFDTSIAKEYGMPAAVLFQDIYSRVEKNRANGKHFHDGLYWTYNSVRAFREMFDYMTPNAIRSGLEKLEADGLIISGNYNADARDRTKWYTVTAKGRRIFGGDL